MAVNVIMPSLGFDMTEATLVAWQKREGDRVEKGQVIAEIEMAKGIVEIEAPAAGVLRKIFIQSSQTVPVGTVLAIITEPDEAIPAAAAPPPVQAAPQSPQPSEKTPTPATPGSETRIKASPLARKIAAEAGVPLAQVSGTGPGGRILERDVRARLTGAPIATAAAVTPAETVAPLSRMRQTIAKRMTESKTTVPHFYVTMEINMAEALRLRAQLNAVGPETDALSINDLIVVATARTLARFPKLNASYRAGALAQLAQINLGIAVALEDGLITPVLREVDKKPLTVIARESKALAERARTHKLRAEDLTASTFTVSNLGMFGVDDFLAIINPPEAAILAVGAVIKRPIAIGDSIQLAPMVKVALSVDHRVADGAEAARFLQALRKLLENPMNLLLP